MSWESDERDSALEKLEKIRGICQWVEKRRLPAHQGAVAEILSIIDGPVKYQNATKVPRVYTDADAETWAE